MKKELVFKGTIERVEYFTNSKSKYRTLIFLKGARLGNVIPDEFINLKVGDKIEYYTYWSSRRLTLHCKLKINGKMHLIKGL